MSASPPFIREIIPGSIITFSVPFSRGPVPFGGRSTAVKLTSGDVFLAASHPIDAETKATIDKLGPVKYIAALDAEHTMSTKQYIDAYPQARLIGPEPVLKKNSDLPWHGVFGRDAEPLGPELAASKEIQAVYFSGHANSDIAFLHAPTKTLIQADLLFNLPAKEQYQHNPSSAFAFWPLSYFANGMHPDGRAHQTLITMVSKDKENMAEGARKVAAWDFDRIVPCHGDVIETGGKEAWRKVFKRWL
ncbi:Hypothetical predicted protein [Olea europaea subsp. europaea]|uniref:Uncharacterized protein n=1 Tax=Olea europaea subsp. europaea TaxID=158383 RepID=A0A8S0SGL1_OLEEU|nr:Hypothetical predicted protein [Olea europaea subsp. europaea]